MGVSSVCVHTCTQCVCAHVCAMCTWCVYMCVHMTVFMGAHTWGVHTCVFAVCEQHVQHAQACALHMGVCARA